MCLLYPNVLYLNKIIFSLITCHLMVDPNSQPKHSITFWHKFYFQNNKINSFSHQKMKKLQDSKKKKKPSSLSRQIRNLNFESVSKHLSCFSHHCFPYFTTFFFTFPFPFPLFSSTKPTNVRHYNVIPARLPSPKSHSLQSKLVPRTNHHR